LRRVVAETDNLDAAVSSLQELLQWRHDKSSLNDRLQSYYAESLDLAAALWDYELLTVEDKIVLEGHEVINKSSVTLGKILRVLLILGIGFWLSAWIANYGGQPHQVLFLNKPIESPDIMLMTAFFHPI